MRRAITIGPVAAAINSKMVGSAALESAKPRVNKLEPDWRMASANPMPAIP